MLDGANNFDSNLVVVSASSVEPLVAFVHRLIFVNALLYLLQITRL